MNITFLHRSDSIEKVSALATVFGASVATKLPDEGIIVEIVYGDSAILEAPLKKFEDVPIGFTDGFLKNFELKWKRHIELVDTSNIRITVPENTDKNSDMLEWIIWYYLEALADKNIGRIWF